MQPNKYIEQFKWSPNDFIYSTWKTSICYLIDVIVVFTKHHMKVI